MPVRRYDVVFVGGGLAAALLLDGLRGALRGPVAVVDPTPQASGPGVHWSYWSRGRTLYDRHAIGEWRRARVGGAPPEPIAPYALRLVRSGDVLDELFGSQPIDWLKTAARSVRSRPDGLYEVPTDAGTLVARWVFDSARGLGPAFPAKTRPWAVLSGTGVRVVSDQPVFDAATATLFDPIDERSFAYLLPLGPREALLESAVFGPVAEKTTAAPLLAYLEDRYPGARFDLTHEEIGIIPLGFAPSRTAGPRHVLLGAKRGLVKPSAGYGVVRIARESGELARLWRAGLPLPPVRRAAWPWSLLDVGFLQLVRKDPRLSMALLGDVMRAVPITDSLSFIDEDLPPRRLARVFFSALPSVLRGALRR
jgi:lycopene beta-cyclase